MKRKKFLLCLGLLLSFVLLALPVRADSGTPYPNLIVGTDGSLVSSQPAYVPKGVLSNPQFGKITDMHLVGSDFYLVDSQNKAIYKTDSSGQILQTISSPDLQQPTGVALDSAGNLYVADPVAHLVVKFDSTGKELAKFTKPTDPLFGIGSPFAPSKIAVDSRGELYIVGTGTTQGLIVLSPTGEFLGYFGGNQAQETLIQQLQSIFGQGFGLKGALNNVAPAPSNVYIDPAGVVYTTTNIAGNTGGLKKLNLAGQNMLPAGMFVPSNTVAVTTNSLGDIFVLTSAGQIGEYDASGDLLFVFGTSGPNGDQIGVFKNPTAISVDASGAVYVVDSETGLVHTFSPTHFAEAVHTGVDYVNKGQYQQARTYFAGIRQQNDNFVLAYNAMANADLLQGDYKAAESNFYTAQNKAGYSQAFWYIRQNWLDANLGWTIILLIGLYVLYRVLKVVKRRTQAFAGVDATVAAVRSNALYDELRDLPRMLRHPIDTLYSFKYEGRGSLRASNIWLGVLLVELGLYLIFTGYLFNSQILQQVNVLVLLVTALMAFLVFVIVNYLIASITDGEGSFKQVYISSIHALAPLVILILPIVLLSNVLTFNESFVIQYSLMIAIVWSIFLLALSISKIQDYGFAGTLKNILLTLFAIAILIFTVYVIGLLAGQLINFIQQIIWEVTRG